MLCSVFHEKAKSRHQLRPGESSLFSSWNGDLRVFFSSALHSIWEIQTSCYYVWLLLLEVGRIYQHVWDVETWRTSNWGVGESHFRLYFQKIGNTGTGWWAEDWIAKDFCRNSTQLKSWRIKEITTVCRLLETSYYHIWSAFLSLCWC